MSKILTPKIIQKLATRPELIRRIRNGLLLFAVVLVACNKAVWFSILMNQIAISSNLTATEAGTLYQCLALELKVTEVIFYVACVFLLARIAMILRGKDKITQLGSDAVFALPIVAYPLEIWLCRLSLRADLQAMILLEERISKIFTVMLLAVAVILVADLAARRHQIFKKEELK